MFFKDISTDMLEEQVSEERDTDLNEEKYLRMKDIREEHWRDVTKDGYDKINIHALRRYFYTIHKEELIKREFLVSTMHP